MEVVAATSQDKSPRPARIFHACCCYNFHRFYKKYLLKGIVTCAKQKNSAPYSINGPKEVIYIQLR